MTKEQIKIFEMPVSDISNSNFDIEIIDTVAEDTGELIRSYMRNRNLTSAWITTGSDDSANTTLIFQIADTSIVSDFFLVGHNFKNFDVEQFDGSNWVLVDSVTNNELDFYYKEIDPTILTTKMRVIIYNTIVADEDKIITRLLICNKLLTGQFKSWPVIQSPTHKVIKKFAIMLSGKYFMSESVGSYKCTLKWKGLNDQDDINLVSSMYLGRRPFVVWICGGAEDQFRYDMIGYRQEDLYVMKPLNDYVNGYYKGLYETIVSETMKLVEVVE